MVIFATSQKNMKVIERHHLVNAVADANMLWDVIVVGGGATGLGTALDSAARGYKTLLLEQADFAKGTSSRSTKLVHGGVRYLAQGDVALVREALYERGLLLKNAPHLVKNKAFIIPNYNWWGAMFYGIGLSIYDLLAGKLGFGRARHISKKEVISRLPNINPSGLYGGVVYHDGQFDDARLAINLAQTIMEKGGTILNYCGVVNIVKNGQQKVSGVVCIDSETNISYQVKGKTIINATGVFVDDLLKMDEPKTTPLVRPSQGVHIVIDKKFMPGDDALMIPKTDDGRVLFAVPWHDKLVVGTTDTPINENSLEPRALEQEIDFILQTAGKFLAAAPTRSDVLSIFAGLRPLAATAGGSTKTKEISRSHKLIVSASGLVTITGGKWTTYRKMGEDTINKAIAVGNLKPCPPATKHLAIHGSIQIANTSNHLYVYGSDQPDLLQLVNENPAWAQKIIDGMPFTQAEVIWGARYEMARTVEDILARRVRALFLDARAAIQMAPKVAQLLAAELGKNEAWQQAQVTIFTTLALGYLPAPAQSYPKN